MPVSRSVDSVCRPRDRAHGRYALQPELLQQVKAASELLRETMIAHSPEHAIQLIDKAFQEADIETLVSFYDDAAVLIDSTGPNESLTFVV